MMTLITYETIKANLEVTPKTIYTDDDVLLSATAESADGINHIDFFVNDELLVNKYVYPYQWTWVPKEPCEHEIKIVAYYYNGKSVTKTTKVMVV